MINNMIPISLDGKPCISEAYSILLIYNSINLILVRVERKSLIRKTLILIRVPFVPDTFSAAVVTTIGRTRPVLVCPQPCFVPVSSSPCSSTPADRSRGMNPRMLAPRHPHPVRSSVPTRVDPRRSPNDHVVIDRVRHSEDPRRHASRGRGQRQSTCCPVHCLLECP